MALRSGHQVFAWLQLLLCENHKVGSCPPGFAPSLSRDLISYVAWGRRESSVGVPTPPEGGEPPTVQTLSSLRFSNLVHRLITNTPSSTPKLASFSTFLQNRNYFGHFLPKSKNRKEMGTANLVQLLILLLKDFFFFNSNSLFGFPSHLYNLPPPHHSPPPPISTLYKITQLGSRECFFLSCPQLAST